MAVDAPFDVKHRSRMLTQGPERAAARAYLKGIGYDDEALAKPLIAVRMTHVFMAGQVAPEAARGGPIAAGADRDEITIDVEMLGISPIIELVDHQR